MKRGYKKGHPQELITRYCPYCHSAIPKINRNGKRYRPAKYKDLKTCGETGCVGMSMSRTYTSSRPAVYKLVIDTPFDKFCYAGGR